jgi:hypothetical protein
VVESDVVLTNVKFRIDFDFILDASNASLCFEVLFTITGVMFGSTKFAERRVLA